MINIFNKLNVKNIYVFAVITKLFVVLIAALNYSLRARVLGQYYNGTYSYINSLLTLIVILAVFGIHEAYAYYRKILGEDFKLKYYGAVQLLVSFYAILVLAIEIVYKKLDVYSVVIVLVPIMAYSKCITGTATIEHPKIKNIVEFGINLPDILIYVIIYLFSKPNIIWIAIIIMLKDICVCFVYTYLDRIKICITIESFVILKKLVFFGIVPMLSLLMTKLNYRVDILMLKKYLDFEQIGVYSVGSSLAEQCWVIPEAVRDILLSKLVLGKKEDEVAKVCKFSFWIMFLLSIIIFFSGKKLICFLFGAEYTDSYYVAVIELFGVLGMIYMKMIMAYNVVKKKPITNLLILSLGVITNILANMILIPVWGINGAAIASMFSYILCGSGFLIVFIKNTKFTAREMILLSKSDIQVIKNILLRRESK